MKKDLLWLMFERFQSTVERKTGEFIGQKYAARTLPIQGNQRTEFRVLGVPLPLLFSIGLQHMYWWVSPTFKVYLPSCHTTLEMHSETHPGAYIPSQSKSYTLFTPI